MNIHKEIAQIKCLWFLYKFRLDGQIWTTAKIFTHCATWTFRNTQIVKWAFYLDIGCSKNTQNALLVNVNIQLFNRINTFLRDWANLKYQQLDKITHIGLWVFLVS